MRRNYIVERRKSVGLLMPTIYLMLEVTMLALLIFLVVQIGVLELVTVAVMTSGVYFVSSCLPRYFRVLKRQAMVTTRPRYAF
jgi:hypothetical protein